MAPPRLDESSAAIKLLRKRFDNGDIGDDDDARSIRMTDPLFMQYKLDTFRTRYNRLKKEYFPDAGKFFKYYFFYDPILPDN